MLLPQEFRNIYDSQSVILSCLKLILSKETLPDVVKFFYSDYFRKVEQENEYPNIYQYIETKSNDFFQNIGVSIYDNYEFIFTCLDFTEEAFQYVFYEYYLSTLKHFQGKSDDTIGEKIDELLNNEFVELMKSSILNSQMEYGNAEHESPYILELDLVDLILSLSEIDRLITERMTLKPLKKLA